MLKKINIIILIKSYFKDNCLFSIRGLLSSLQIKLNENF
jgi:hypothetical protein